MRRIRIRIAYDGTDYCGFQQQPGISTIEGELNRALSMLTHEDIHIIGASRTDSGVHADGNVAVFDTASTIPAERFAVASARFMPADIRITASDEVSSDWHPRKRSCVKTYEYNISCGDHEDPLKRRYAEYSRRFLDVERMRQAAAYLVGEHDFTSFANPSSQILLEGGSATKEIFSIKIEKIINNKEDLDHNIIKLKNIDAGKPIFSSDPNDPVNAAVREKVIAAKDPECFHKLNAGVGNAGYTEEVRITVKGSGFLYNMVRIIAGTLINVGNGLWAPEQVKEALEARDRTKAGPTAGARGLKLVGIRYL